MARKEILRKQRKKILRKQRKRLVCGDRKPAPSHTRKEEKEKHAYPKSPGEGLAAERHSRLMTPVTS